MTWRLVSTEWSSGGLTRSPRQRTPTHPRTPPGSGGGFSIGSVSIGGKKESAYISIDLRVVDSTTGKVAFSRAIEANDSGGGLSGGLRLGMFSGNLGGFEKKPTGKAVRACVIEIVEYLECVMVNKGDCMSAYDAKEQRRKAKTKKSITLDE